MDEVIISTVRRSDKIIQRIIPIRHVLFLRAEDKYVMVYHTAGEEVMDEPLYYFRDKHPDLIQIHRSILVNIDRIISITKVGCKGLMKLRGTDIELPISKLQYAKTFRVMKKELEL